jgi:uncharacterized membrane protein
MHRPIGVDLRPIARTGLGTLGFDRYALALAGTVALAIGLARRSVAGALLAVLGGALAYRGITGTSLRERLVEPDAAARPRFRLSVTTRPGMSTIVASSITVNRDREPVYLFWRNASNVALLHEWIVGVDETVDGQPLWRIRLPGGRTIEIPTRLVEEVELERVAWESLDDGGFRLGVELRDPPDRRGTEVTLSARAPGPGGPLRPLRRFTTRMAEAQLDEMLRRARALLETGEIPRTDGQPSGRQEQVQPVAAAAR